VADGGQLLGQATAKRRHKCEQAKRQVPQGANSARSSGESGEPMGKCNHSHGLGATSGCIRVELVLATFP
jgi:hypothetical protein